MNTEELMRARRAKWWHQRELSRAERIRNATSHAASVLKYRTTVKYRWSDLQSAAKQRGLKVTITKEAFTTLLYQACHYCGIKPVKLGGVDRFDSRLDYTSENCRPACELCNRMKWAYSFAEWLEHMRKIMNHCGSPPSGTTSP